MRTYSKSRSLAGARLGFAFASEEIIADLNKLKFSTNPYSINRLTLIAGEAALRNRKYYDDNAQKIIETRAYVTAKLREMGFEVIESAANFVLAGRDDISGSLFAEEMKKRGILIRHFSGGRLEKYNRITIGTRAEMDAFLFTLGCYSGEPITVIARRRGGCVVSIKDGRYNIDNQLAEAIII